MAAEFVAHGGEESVGVRALAAGREAAEEGGAEDRDGDAFVDGGEHGPAALAGVGDAAGEVVEVGVLRERVRRQVEQPRGDDAAAPPDLRTWAVSMS